jgi:MerR family copper efflux transcriptional regulator
MDTPIACSLSASDLRTRTDELSALAARALVRREPIAHGERLTFRAEFETEVKSAIAAEQTCCSFLAFATARDGETLVVDVTGPADAQPIIAELFA